MPNLPVTASSRELQRPRPIPRRVRDVITLMFCSQAGVQRRSWSCPMSPAFENFFLDVHSRNPLACQCDRT